MTDPGMADVTYIEPLNAKVLTEIIAQERPDALLPNLGGQTGLNLSSELHRPGVLEEYGVKVIGVNVDAIERGEDRFAFKETMDRLGIEMPRSKTVTSVEDAEKVADELGYPVVIRPAYTMGGTGGGLVYNVEELRVVASRGLAASLVDQILVEESVLGWEELELEVVRDAKNQMITVCFIENVDAMGVHTGDSFCTAPMLTIDPALQKRLQEYSYAIVEAIEVIGGTNIQFAHDPKTGRVVVIEINPRTSRSSALASKATGFPIARVSALLAGGLTLDEIPYWRDGTPGKIHPLGRLRGGQVRALGLREVQGRSGQAGHPDAGRGRGHEHRQDLQGGLPEGHPLAGNRPLRAGFRQGLQQTSAGGAAGAAWPSPPASASSSCTRPCARAPTSRSCTP
ncbi:MAG: ATP-grasp domain-containing protein [Desulfobacterales bacterium]|nr:ATP-grasp domain-containing protein [Desulfobacterales bacterium]